MLASLKFFPLLGELLRVEQDLKGLPSSASPWGEGGELASRPEEQRDEWLFCARCGPDEGDLVQRKRFRVILSEVSNANEVDMAAGLRTGARTWYAHPVPVLRSQTTG